MSSIATGLPGSIPVPEPDLTPEEVVARAQAFVPMLRAQQDEAEQRGYYSQAVHEEFQRAGVYRITQPRRFGGYQFDLRTFLRAMVAISSGDPGTGWCVTLGSSHAWMVASHFSEEVQAEVFGPDGDFRCPHPVAPTGEAVAVDGGYRVTGRFPYASGIPYATWAFATALIAGDPPTPLTILVPRSDLTMLDDWGDGRTLGMNSSGSNTFVIEGAFVPERRTMLLEEYFDPPSPHTPGVKLHRNPLYIGRPAAPYHTSLVAPIVGAAKAAIDAFREYIMVKPTTFQPQVPRYQFHEDQRAYGLAIAKTDAAETILYSFADQYVEAAARAVESGERIDRVQDARWWALLQQAGGLAAEAVQILAQRATSSTSGRGQPLGRYLRDVLTYRQHISAQQSDFAVRNAAMYLGASDRWTF
jgi:3-hydroxy-9,10-secoandrosta-1,3,5(10)-triene-9,17-dione monooxygenase